MKIIELKVSDELASKLEQVPKERLGELEQVIAEWLDPRKALLKTVRETQEYAKEQGLTDDKLNELLNDNK